MARKPEKKAPPQSKKAPGIKAPGKLTAADFDMSQMDLGEDDFEEDFTYNESVRMLQAEYKGLEVSAAMERAIRAFILAADTPGHPGLREAKTALKDHLDEIMDDGITADRVLGKIFQFVDGGVAAKPEATPAEIRRRTIGAMELAIAERIDGIKETLDPEAKENRKTIKALDGLAKKFRQGQPGEKEAELLLFITNAAMDGKLPQAYDAGYYERLKRDLSDHLVQDVLDGRNQLAQRVMNDAILAAAQEITAPMVGGVRK